MSLHWIELTLLPKELYTKIHDFIWWLMSVLLGIESCTANLIKCPGMWIVLSLIQFFGWFWHIPDSCLSLFSLGVSVCTHTMQCEHQRCNRTGRVQKNHKISRKNTIFNEHWTPCTFLVTCVKIHWGYVRFCVTFRKRIGLSLIKI